MTVKELILILNKVKKDGGENLPVFAKDTVSFPVNKVRYIGYPDDDNFLLLESDD